MDGSETMPRDYLKNAHNAGGESDVKKIHHGGTTTTKGVAMSFGFRRHLPEIPKTETIDRNGNGTTTNTRPLTAKPRGSLRQPETGRRPNLRYNVNRPASATQPTTDYIQSEHTKNNNNYNRQKNSKLSVPVLSAPTTLIKQHSVDTNKNFKKSYPSHDNRPSAQQEVSDKLIVQTRQIPKPQFATNRLHELKDTKTLLNNNRKINQNQSQPPQQQTQDDLMSLSDSNSLEIDLCIRDELAAPVDSLLPRLPSAFQETKGREARIGKAILNRPQSSEITSRHFEPKCETSDSSKNSFLKSKSSCDECEDYEWMPQAGDALADDCSVSLTLSTNDTAPDHHKPKKPESLMWAAQAAIGSRHGSFKPDEVSSSILDEKKLPNKNSVDSTYRKPPSAIENSPLFLRKKAGTIGSRTGSTNTLSPCDSINSDDLMLDFEPSQDEKQDDDDQKSVSGIDEFLRECSSFIAATSKTFTPLVNHQNNSRATRSRINKPPNSSASAVQNSPVRRLSRPTLNDQPCELDNLPPGSGLATQQDMMQMMSMLLKLKKTLNRSESLISLDQQSVAKIDAPLNIEDPKFAAVAEAGNTEPLLEDEPCPIDNILTCSESEDKHCQFPNDSSSNSNSKDVNEKETSKNSTNLSPASPTDDSLSLSDSKDYFDDEIADQPALIFDDTLTPNNNPSDDKISPVELSESNITLVDSLLTPKRCRKPPSAIENSPLFVRRKIATLGSRTGSIDTLSPCESITSDDLMLDFEHSQDEKQDSDPEYAPEIDELLSECSTLIAGTTKTPMPLVNQRHARVLRSRTSRSSSPARAIPSSPARRLNRPTLNDQYYESDDSMVGESLAVQQDMVQIKMMLLKLKRTLNQAENFLPIDPPVVRSEDATELELKMMLAESKRQIQFLQDQLEDREQAMVQLEKEMMENRPVERVIDRLPLEIPKSNAATQTERVRPLSTSSSLIQMSPTDSGMSSLVSSTKPTRRSVCSVGDDKPINFFINKPILMYPIGIL